MDYPIVLDAEGKYLAILNHAYNIMVDDQLLSTSDGYETLTFMISNHDPKRYLLANEREVQVQGRRYVVRVIEDLKNNSNVCTVTCDASWYDLNDGELKYLMRTDNTTITAEESVVQQLEGTGWTLGTVDVPGTRPKHTSESKDTSLYNLRQIAGNYGGDLFFDTRYRRVDLLAKLGTRHQKLFCYEKNTTSIKRTVDTRDLFTRFSLIGKDSDGNDVTVADINGGLDYVENYEWFDLQGLPRKIKWYNKKDDRFSNKQNMLEYMQSWLDTYSKPIISYELAVSLFDVSPNLGDYVCVYDKDLNIKGWLRVVSRKKNILEPHKSTVVLESNKKSIVTSIVSTTTTSQTVQDIVSDIVTPDNQIKLPPGTEDWIMQYKNGAWKAQPVDGSIVPAGKKDQVMIRGEKGWEAKDVEGSILPAGADGFVLQYREVDKRWVAENVVQEMKNYTKEQIKTVSDEFARQIGAINALLDALNGEVL